MPRKATIEVHLVFRNHRAIEVLHEMAELCESLVEDLPWRDEPRDLKARLAELPKLIAAIGETYETS